MNLLERRCYHCRCCTIFDATGEIQFHENPTDKGFCLRFPPQAIPQIVEFPSKVRAPEIGKSGEQVPVFVVRTETGFVDGNYPPVHLTTFWCMEYRRHWRRWIRGKPNDAK